MIRTANRASALLYRLAISYPNGKYILPANVCPIVPITLSKAGVAFEFFDIDKLTLCLDEDKVLSALSQNLDTYVGIIFIRSYGYLYDTTEFFSKVKTISKNILIIDDKCLCFPDLKPLAPNVDMELYSTGYGKMIDIGYGGFAKVKEEINLNFKEIEFIDASLQKVEKNYKDSLEKRQRFLLSNDDWLDASDLPENEFDYFEKIKNLTDRVATHKNKLNTIYQDILPSDISLVPAYNKWRYNILVDNKNEILDMIFKQGFFASSHYIPSSILFNDINYPIANDLSKRIINLFNDFYFTEEQARDLAVFIKQLL